jgi:hypothetical protein
MLLNSGPSAPVKGRLRGMDVGEDPGVAAIVEVLREAETADVSASAGGWKENGESYVAPAVGEAEMSASKAPV